MHCTDVSWDSELGGSLLLRLADLRVLVWLFWPACAMDCLLLAALVVARYVGKVLARCLRLGCGCHPHGAGSKNAHQMHMECIECPWNAHGKPMKCTGDAQAPLREEAARRPGPLGRTGVAEARPAARACDAGRNSHAIPTQS